MKVAAHPWNGDDPRQLARKLRADGALASKEIGEAVAGTLGLVASGGDLALAELSERFDGVSVESAVVPPRVVKQALEELNPALREALEVAATNIRAVAEAQLSGPRGPVVLPQGQSVQIDEVPVSSAAIYAPGGRAPYPSTVLMGVIPALVAGVERVVVASPPGPDGRPEPAVMAAACLAGAHEVLAVGGAQAIAALAYGTETIEPVDVIAGPGSPYVQEAKLLVSRQVGIDGYAGPSELVVVCDGSSDSDAVALDLAAQAEHGDDGLLVAICEGPEIAERVVSALEGVSHGRESVRDARVDLITSAGRDSSIALAQALAPEHLQLAFRGAADAASAITTAGCVFIGNAAATAFGDYAAGSNHILPTGGAGRFTGPVGPATFRRRISRVSIDSAAAAELAPTTDLIARAEGFPVHGESARHRADGEGIRPREGNE